MYELSVRAPSTEGLPSPLPLWLQPEYLLAVQSLQQAEAFHLLCRKGDSCVAIMPLYERKYLGLKRLICPLSAYYQGLWFFWEAGREANRNLLDELKVSGEVAEFLQGRYQRAHFNLAPHNQDVRGFTGKGFKAHPLYTFTHATSQPLSLLSDERKNLRSALKLNYRLEEQFLPGEFVGMLKDLHQRKDQRFGLPYSGFEQWLVRLHEHGLLTQFNLMREGKLASSNLLLGGSSDRTGYSIMICTLPEEMKNGASSLHYSLLVEQLRGRFDRLDFCGGNVAEVARFKAALGLNLEIFFRIRG